MNTDNCYVHHSKTIGCREEGRTNKISDECELYKDYKHPAIKFSRHLSLLNHPNIRIDVIYEWDNKRAEYRMYTDDLRYKDKLEIVFDNDKNIFVIHRLDKIKEKWNLTHGISNNPLDKFLEYESEFEDDL